MPSRSAKKRKKDEKLLKEAVERIQSAKRVRQLSEIDRWMKRLPPETATKVKQLQEEFYSLIEVKYGFLRESKELIRMPVHVINLSCEKDGHIERLDEPTLTKYIEEIHSLGREYEEKLKKIAAGYEGSKPSRTLIPLEEYCAFHCRAYVRREENNFEGSLEDLREAMALATHKKLTMEECTDVVWTHAFCLYDRLMNGEPKLAASSWLASYKETVAIFRGCCAACRIEESTEVYFSPAGPLCVLLSLMVAEKHYKNRSRSRRPFFPPDERYDLEKELGLNRFSKELHRCDHCSADETQRGVKLQQCGGCEKVWYCGATCQSTAWKNGHKVVCSKKAEQFCLSESKLADIISVYLYRPSASRDPFITDAKKQPHLISYDPQTGECFDCLTDETLVIPRFTLIKAILCEPTFLFLMLCFLWAITARSFWWGFVSSGLLVLWFCWLLFAPSKIPKRNTKSENPKAD